MKEYYKNKIRKMLDDDLIPFEKIEFAYFFMRKAEDRAKAEKEVK